MARVRASRTGTTRVSGLDFFDRIYQLQGFAVPLLRVIFAWRVLFASPSIQNHSVSFCLVVGHKTCSQLILSAAANGIAHGNANAYAAADAEEGGKKTKSREVASSASQAKAVSASKQVDHLGIES